MLLMGPATACRPSSLLARPFPLQAGKTATAYITFTYAGNDTFFYDLSSNASASPVLQAASANACNLRCTSWGVHACHLCSAGCPLATR